MGTYVPDPEIERLVAEMNRLVERREDGHGDPEGAVRDLDEPRLQVVASDEILSELLSEMVRRQASDLLLVPGAQPVVRINGQLSRLDGDVLGGGTVRTLFAPHLGGRSRRLLAETGAADFSLNLSSRDAEGGGVRLRVNIQRQGGQIAARNGPFVT